MSASTVPSNNSFVDYVLSIIGTLSLLFQKDIANLTVIKHSVTSTAGTIQGMIDGSPKVNRVLADLSDVPGTGKDIYKRVEIADNNTSEPGSTQYKGDT